MVSLKPSVLIVAEAYKFHQAKQESGESVSLFANRLRRLSANCQYENFLSRVLRDQFVCGIRNTNTLKKLLAQDLTFKECLDKALADETADKESRDLATSMESVHFTKKYNQKRKSSKTNKCYRCGSEGHYADKCNYKDSGSIFDYCHRPNHTTKECFKKKNDEKRRRSNVNFLKQQHFEEDQDILVPMFTIQEETGQQLLSGPTHMINMIRQASYKTDVILDGKTINMDIDTGSGVTVLSKQDFDKIGGDLESLQTSNLILKGYSGGRINCLGEKVMSIQINNQTKDAVIRVVDSKGLSLLGRDLISIFTLPWENIFKVNTNSEYDKIFDRYTDLFDNSQVGIIKGLKIQLHVNDDIKPIFRKT